MGLGTMGQRGRAAHQRGIMRQVEVLARRYIGEETMECSVGGKDTLSMGYSVWGGCESIPGVYCPPQEPWLSL